jgi:hypothetical protein
MTTQELQDQAILAFEAETLQNEKDEKDRQEKESTRAEEEIVKIFPEAKFLKDEKQFQLCGYRFGYFFQNCFDTSGKLCGRSYYLKGEIGNGHFIPINSLSSLGRFLLAKGVNKSVVES